MQYSGIQDIQMIDSAVDKLRLAMSPNGQVQRNQNLMAGNRDFEISNSNNNAGTLGNNASLHLMLAALNATHANHSDSTQSTSPTLMGGIGNFKGGLLLDNDDSPRSMFGLHPELTPKIDNINILFGTPPSQAKSPSVKNGTDSVHGSEFIHQREKQLYKTELCMLWLEKGFCEFGSQCKFAHSDTEKRNIEKHPKYKTRICRNIVENGNCPFGRRCHFLHPNEPPTSNRLPIFKSLAPKQ